MRLLSWLRERIGTDNLDRPGRRGPRATTKRPAPRFPPKLEYLEDRVVPSAGVLDPTFGTGGMLTTGVGFGVIGSAMAIQADGKIVVAGSTVGSTDNDFLLVRYNADGSLDDGTAADSTPGDRFGSSGNVVTDFAANSDEARAMAIQPDGRSWSPGERS